MRSSLKITQCTHQEMQSHYIGLGTVGESHLRHGNHAEYEHDQGQATHHALGPSEEVQQWGLQYYYSLSSLRREIKEVLTKKTNPRIVPRAHSSDISRSGLAAMPFRLVMGIVITRRA